jgi:agmatinase
MAAVPQTFCGLKGGFSAYAAAKFAVLPVPYDRTTSYGKGTGKGPKAIINASRYLELYDEELYCNPAEAGIATLKPLKVAAKPEKMADDVRASVLGILEDGKVPVLLGGEHSISSGAVAAMKEHHGEITVLQFDAHADLKETYQGTPFSHACAMARIRQHAETVQVGIRSLADEEAELVKRLRAERRLFYSTDVLERDCIGDILGSLGEKVYVTFDVDAFDPSLMPSTGTPEPGGLFWYDVMRILRAACDGRHIVGFDVNELAPIPGLHAPDFTAAKLAYKLMGYSLPRR